MFFFPLFLLRLIWKKLNQLTIYTKTGENPHSPQKNLCGQTDTKFLDMCGQTDTKFLDMCGRTDTKILDKKKWVTEEK